MILQAISRLPERSREIIGYTLEGLKIDQIAERMNISPNTVKSIKYAALRNLRQMLDQTLLLMILI